MSRGVRFDYYDTLRMLSIFRYFFLSAQGKKAFSKFVQPNRTQTLIHESFSGASVTCLFDFGVSLNDRW